MPVTNRLHKAMVQVTGSRAVVAIVLALLASAVLGDAVSPELVQVGHLRLVRAKSTSISAAPRPKAARVSSFH
jgi:hypothetical protein